MTNLTENELFDKSMLEAINSAIESYEKNDLDGWELYLVKSRAELADKENVDIETFIKLNGILATQVLELQAQINELRKALEDYEDDWIRTGWGFNALTRDKAKQILAKTAPQCLIEHDTKVLQDALKERELQQNKAFNDKVLNDFYDSVKDNQ